MQIGSVFSFQFELNEVNSSRLFVAVILAAASVCVRVYVCVCVWGQTGVRLRSGIGRLDVDRSDGRAVGRSVGRSHGISIFSFVLFLDAAKNKHTYRENRKRVCVEICAAWRWLTDWLTEWVNDCQTDRPTVRRHFVLTNASDSAQRQFAPHSHSHSYSNSHSRIPIGTLSSNKKTAAQSLIL